jgi:HAE1 family hydrophobic/amphiphilic exporter-1
MLFVAVALVGMLAFSSLGVDFLPQVNIPRLIIRTSHSPISPREMETSVTQPIESTIRTVAGVKKVTSVSRETMSLVTAEFSWSTNMDYALIEVREKLDQVRAHLPQDAGRSTIICVNPSLEPIMVLALSISRESGIVGSNGTSRGDLLCRERILMETREAAFGIVKRRIEQIEGVAQAAVFGGVEREIEIQVDQMKLCALGLSPDDVTQAVAAANLNMPGGSIRKGMFRCALRTVGEFGSVGEIRDVVVGRTASGMPVTLGQVATVNDTFKERLGLTRFNGQEVIAMHVRKEGGSNTVRVSQRIHQVLQEICREQPSLHLAVLSDHAEFIEKSVNDVEMAIVIGALLAFVVLFVFLRGLRHPLIIGLSMPVSILGTFIVMYCLRIQLNVISLAGLALGIGMLGDNAIVVIENINRLREQGCALIEATVAGAKGISLAATASTLTNVAVFLPVVFVEGAASRLFSDMGITMTISLVVSLFVAVTLVPVLALQDFHRRSRLVWSRRQGGPVMARLMGKQAAATARVFRRISVGLEVAVRRSMDRYLTWALCHRPIVVILTALSSVGGVLLAAVIPNEALPGMDRRRFSVNITMPKGTSLESLTDISGKIENSILQLPGVTGVYAEVGVTDEMDFWRITESACEHSFVMAHLDLNASLEAIIGKTNVSLGLVQQATPGLRFDVRREETMLEHVLRPEEEGIRIRITGNDADVCALIGEKLIDEAFIRCGVVNAGLHGLTAVREYSLRVDRERAGQYGMSARDVAEQIARMAMGKEATTFNDFNRRVTVRVRQHGRKDQSLDDILSSSIAIGGIRVPVRELVTWEEVIGAGEIRRTNQQQELVLPIDAPAVSRERVISAMEQSVRSLRLPEGYRVVLEKGNEISEELLYGLIMVIVLSVVLVYMILAAEYESLVYPFVIVLTSPLAFVGAVGAMGLAGQHFNMMSLIGVVVMVGAVDNDAVIAVDVIVGLRREGDGLAAAVRRGMQQRLRPILMTTSTTLLGMIPLNFDFGAGSELLRALSIPLVGGLVSTTLYTVVSIPIVYSYVDQWATGSKIRDRS